MPKYDIYVEETYTKEYIVEANSPEEAFRELHNDFLTGKRKRPDILETSKMVQEFIVPEEQEEE